MFGFSGKTINTDLKKIEEILSRNIEEVFVLDSLKKRLLSGEKLRIKLGFDPTGSNIHIGRASILRKLKSFQDLGHQIIFIVGDFTAKIGDPSDKLEKRPTLSKEQILENLKNYKDQVGKIIDISKVEFLFNSEWLSKLGFEEVTQLAESFSVQQMLNRRNFKDRFDKGVEISIREFLYPLMQGYDSVAVSADVEIGGFDQLFNLKAGRVIQKHYGKKEQDIMTVKMLEGTDGRKMSTSWGNVINIIDDPYEMYGKIMSINDNLIYNYFVSCTDLSLEEINNISKELEEKENYKEAKSRLAKEVVSIYHGKDYGEKAEKNFEETFSKKGTPENILKISISENTPIVDVLIDQQIIESKTEWRRLVSDGAVSKDGVKIIDSNINSLSGIYKIGKRRFIQIIN
ncbi:MAG: tyrosine--tRNA ligase [Candidatus Paceibacterota bacterium]